MSLCAIWIESDCPANWDQGLFELARLQKDHAQQVQCVDMIGRQSQNFLVQLLGFTKISLPMQHNGLTNFLLGPWRNGLIDARQRWAILNHLNED